MGGSHLLCHVSCTVPIHTPWLVPLDERRAANSELGTKYPHLTDELVCTLLWKDIFKLANKGTGFL